MTRMKNVIISVFVSGLFAFSSNTSQAQITKISVNPPSQDIGGLMLSDLIESIEYIPLQTEEDIVIGNVHLFDISANYIVVRCSQSSIVYLFKKNGQFVSQIGNIGSGPGEYLKGLVNGVFIDEQQNQILIQARNPKRFMIFNLATGKFEKSEPLPENTGTYLRLHNNMFIASTPNIRGEVPYVYQLITRDYKLVSEQIKTVFYEKIGSSETNFPAPITYEYQGVIHTKERTLNDTIYAIDKDHIFRAKHVLNAGAYEVTKELRADAQNFIQKIKDYAAFASVAETKNYLLFSYIYQRKDVFDYYDKVRRKAYHLDSQQGIPNDYDGGISFWPQWQGNNVWYAFYNAHLFEERLESEKKLTSKGGQQAIQKFNNMYKNLDPEDNPVLVIVKLKE